MKGEYPLGATPLTPDEEDGLIPQHITLRAELNEFEQANIVEAETWLQNRRGIPSARDSAFLKELHRRMFGQVWKWAGKYRKTDRNLGVHWPKISSETEALCREVEYWCKDRVYPPDELALRFHRKLVWIHCYQNGNGRHSRFAADLLITELGSTRFTWGSANLDAPGDVRSRYINSLRSADKNDFEPLLAFARS
jgi:Fic-DOC domain mobile mystery protein B